MLQWFQFRLEVQESASSDAGVIMNLAGDPVVQPTILEERGKFGS